MNRDSGTAGASTHIGQLLVAAPSLLDPNFARSVLLLCDVNPDGALGLVLNRPSTTAVAEHLPHWEVASPEMVFIGGPVQPEIAVGLARVVGESPVGFSKVYDDIGLFDLATPTELVAGAIAQLRVFSGYSGWGAGQLATELDSGDWVVVDHVPDDVFTAEPSDLWETVLRRQGGETALLANFPSDPSLN